MYSLLVVEDEKLIREGITSLINFEEIEISQVEQAENGEVALEKIKLNRPDIVLTDINMPHMDGITLAQKIKSIYPQTHIIFLTGYDYFDYALSAIKLGADDYVLKPISKKDIEEILIKTVNKLKEEKKKNAVIELIKENDNTNDSTDIKEIIDKQLDDTNLSLKLVAKQLGFSPNYLSSLIKKDLGLSFQDYVITQRINRAKILLLSTEFKIYEIASKVGFDDVNYFSSRFKQVTGMTPRQYQRGMEDEK